MGMLNDIILKHPLCSEASITTEQEGRNSSGWWPFLGLLSRARRQHKTVSPQFKKPQSFLCTFEHTVHSQAVSEVWLAGLNGGEGSVCHGPDVCRHLVMAE